MPNVKANGRPRRGVHEVKPAVRASRLSGKLGMTAANEDHWS